MRVLNSLRVSVWIPMMDAELHCKSSFLSDVEDSGAVRKGAAERVCRSARL